MYLLFNLQFFIPSVLSECFSSLGGVTSLHWDSSERKQQIEVKVKPTSE